MPSLPASAPVAPPSHGVAYTCVRCGDCCRWPGFVRVDEAEQDRLASALGLSAAQFIADHTRLADDRRGLVLSDRPDGACILLGNDNRCRVYAARPAQCRDFPHGWSVPDLERLCPAIRLRFQRHAWPSARPSPYAATSAGPPAGPLPASPEVAS